MSVKAKENPAHFIQMSVLQRVTHHKDAKRNSAEMNCDHKYIHVYKKNKAKMK